MTHPLPPTGRRPRPFLAMLLSIAGLLVVVLAPSWLGASSSGDCDCNYYMTLGEMVARADMIVVGTPGETREVRVPVVRNTDGAPDSYAWIPFGGGVRRCVGAAFAAMEMSEVLRAVAARVTLRPDRARSERMRRRSVTLTPERWSTVIAEPLRSN